ncbi:hypothetical protein [Bradyrhizobium sp.]|uniref:hypothetical protein n=1 Tax=Bradyrhizobium sp. TaxID=376 RepID=UPI003C77B9A0
MRVPMATPCASRVDGQSMVPRREKTDTNPLRGIGEDKIAVFGGFLACQLFNTGTVLRHSRQD